MIRPINRSPISNNFYSSSSTPGNPRDLQKVPNLLPVHRWPRALHPGQEFPQGHAHGLPAGQRGLDLLPRTPLGVFSGPGQGVPPANPLSLRGAPLQTAGPHPNRARLHKTLRCLLRKDQRAAHILLHLDHIPSRAIARKNRQQPKPLPGF